jgi:hypothetical protein
MENKTNGVPTALKLLKEITSPWPPFLVYAIARHRVGSKWVRGMSIEQVSDVSGLPVRTCARVASKLTWEREKQFVIDAFCTGCGFSFFDTADQKKYVVRTTRHRESVFSHLNGIRRTFLERRCKQFIQLKGK